LVGQELETARRPRILITNDDGYQAPGLIALVDSLLPIADITVVAPLEQQSGTGHGITFRDPINIHKLGNSQNIDWYAVAARPATVVRVALAEILDSMPDLVVAGINTGDNVGTNAWVSGTVAAAREAALAGLPALAFSVDPFGSNPYSIAAGWARQIVEQLQDAGRIQPPLLLNVNLPGEEPLGVRVAHMSLAVGTLGYDRRESPRGQEYVWDEWSAPEDDPDEGTDLYWFYRGYVTITPLRIDQTDTAELPRLELLFKQP
jgi:5'-nucleotidase